MKNTTKLPYEEAQLLVITLADVISTSDPSWSGGSGNVDDDGWTH